MPTFDTGREAPGEHEKLCIDGQFHSFSDILLDGEQLVAPEPMTVREAVKFFTDLTAAAREAQARLLAIVGVNQDALRRARARAKARRS